MPALVAPVMMASITDLILGLHGWAALAVVFLLPALESSAFIGFVFPGEIAVLLGGVLAYQHKVSLPGVIVAAVAGAIVGDTIGYEIGKRWGRRILHGTVGRIVKHEHLDRAEAYLAERGGKAVFFGRFTAALRVLIPGLAGMSGLRYRTFLAYNAAGGTLWAAGFVLAGYGAGGSWRSVEHIAGRASLVLLGAAVVAVLVVVTARKITNHQQALRAFATRQSERPRIASLRRRYRRQLAFLARRLSRDQALGLWLTVSLVAIIVTGWAAGTVVQDVVAGDDAVRFDRPVLEWFAGHREPWLTTIAKVVTDLGASAVLIPVIVTMGGLWWRRRRTPRPLVLLAAAYVGSDLLFRAIKALTNRPRPPSASAVAHFAGLAFPSGHAIQATAVWGALAALAAANQVSWRRKVVIWTIAVSVAAIVGVTRLYLGAHWLTDVLGGWTLGALWLTVVLTSARTLETRGNPGDASPQAEPGPA